MRSLALIALVLAGSPALAEECRYYNQNDQSVIWSGGAELTYDPAYTTPTQCSLTPIAGTNGFKADCHGWDATFVPGASTRDGKNADIVVFGEIFYWLKCVKDHA